MIVSHCPLGYVLKILNALDSKKEDFIDAQNQLLLYLGEYSRTNKLFVQLLITVVVDLL